MYSKGRKCSSCGKAICDTSKRGMCVGCWHRYNKGASASNWRGGLEGRLIRELEKNSKYEYIFNNDAERVFYGMMVQQGWTVSKGGWPDFLCFKQNGDELMVVEVKSNSGQEPKPIQQFILKLLAARGVEAFLWNPETGFTKVGKLQNRRI